MQALLAVEVGKIVVMDAWGTTLALAARQYGAVTVRQVGEEVGLDPSTFRRRARREGWSTPVRGVWSPPGCEDGRLHDLSVALLAAGVQARVTGVDALSLHGCRVDLPATMRLVTSMNDHAARHLPASAKLISSRTLLPTDATSRRRLAVVSPTRAFVDLVIPPSPPVGDVRDLLVVARQRGLLTGPGMFRTLRTCRGVPGLPILHRAVGDILEVEADSPFSDRVHRRLRRDGFAPDPQPVGVDVGGRILHPDITFSGQRIAIECDSLLHHAEQRDLMVDGRKDRSYRRSGWEPVRIGWFEYRRFWDDFVSDLRETLRG